MAVIGYFIPSRDGGWIGSIRTLTIDAKVHFAPNDDRHASNAPTFGIFVGQSRIGHAWEARSSGETPKTYFSVKLDDPALTEPITAALFPAEDGNTAQLIWKRLRLRRTDDRSTNSF